MQVTLADIEAACDRLDDESVVRETPVETSRSLAREVDATVRLKMEHLQRTGSFKTRGAYNKLTQVTGVGRAVAASAGNHAQGVALAATKTGIDSTIVMPKDAPQTKIDATAGYGAEIVLHGDNFPEAMGRARELVDDDSVFVHAYDDPAVVAGQGTLGLEILSQVPDADTVLVPIGGGGLIGGIATAIKSREPDVRIVGIQAADAATVPQSLDKGQPQSIDSMQTIADGIATRTTGERTFEVIRDRVDEVVTVSDPEIAVALTTLLERSKTLAEGAGAVPIAALLEEKFDYAEDETVVPTLCGGNIDLNTLTNVIMRGLVETGRYCKIRTVLEDRPGSLEELVEVLSAAKVNIYGIEHDRTSRDIAMNDTEVVLDLETRGHDHVDELLAGLEAAGYEVEVLV